MEDFVHCILVELVDEEEAQWKGVATAELLATKEVHYIFERTAVARH